MRILEICESSGIYGKDLGMSVRKEIWIEPPENGVGVSGGAEYCGPAGLKMVRHYVTVSMSDRTNAAYRQYSEDNGRTWSESKRMPKDVRHEGDNVIEFGTGVPFVLAPDRNVQVRFSREIVLPGGEVLEGCKHRKIFYEISPDGGASFGPLKQLIEDGSEFDSTHYMNGVFDGKNSATMSSHLVLAPGKIMVAVYIFPVDEKGNLYNPFGGYTYGDVGFIRGKLTADAADIAWKTTQIVRLDPDLSIRGLSEPAMTRLSDGRLLCVSRGSNGNRGAATPGGSWVSVSGDEGKTWSELRRLGFDDGGILYNPASMSHLLRHSNGKLYIIANIVPLPPRGNHPRYPLVLAEVNEQTSSVVRESMTTIDTRQEGEAESLELSNFGLYEDRETHEMVVTLARLFANGPNDWTTPCFKYSVQLDNHQ